MDNLIMLLDEMDKILQRISPISVKIKKKDILKFYEITGESIERYHKSNGEIVSPNYLMTLLAPIGTRVMIKILEHDIFPKIIDGIVHSQSEIRFLQPLSYGDFQVWCRVEGLQKKTGKMGDYLVLTFRMVIRKGLNKKEEEMAHDIHQFFLRLKKGVD